MGSLQQTHVQISTKAEILDGLSIDMLCFGLLILFVGVFLKFDVTMGFEELGLLEYLRKM